MATTVNGPCDLHTPWDSTYEKSVSSLSRVTLDSDNVFRDGHDWQVATVTGDATNGYKVALTVAVAAA